VLLEVLRIDVQPVFSGVSPRLGVPGDRGPGLFRKAPQESGRVRANGFDDRERRFERSGVVVEGPRPLRLVVADDQGILLGGEIADPQ